MAAVVLLSGGLDSTVTLAKAISDGHEVTALSFRYGQRHERELESAKRICRRYGIDHVIMDIDLTSFRSSLTQKKRKIPERSGGSIGKDIPSTYVPARNILFLSAAAGLCESIDADTIYIGANAIDYSGYPDCRPGFFKKFEEMLKAGTKAGAEGRPLKIETPILDMSKKDIVLLGTELKAPLEMTWSCYAGREKACGRCDSCRLRMKGFAEAGVNDATEYE